MTGFLAGGTLSGPGHPRAVTAAVTRRIAAPAGRAQPPAPTRALSAVERGLAS